LPEYELKTFKVPVWVSENYWCPPIEKDFVLNVDPSRIKSAYLEIDLNPTMPGWPTNYGCVEGEKIYVNGMPLRYEGNPCDVIKVEIPPDYLMVGKNTIHFDIRASPFCAVSPQGNLSGTLVLNVYVKPGEEPVTPPEEMPKPCKILGGLVDLGKLPPSVCSTINMAATLMTLAFGALILIRLLK